ncbi:hypothetical protein V1478_010991 [Vespula squamosa]|uniref:Uncharacterized protein n=1 Tax=Vespula squamosa TaxID=30214 RepID=A0ABD2AFY5_VESSQ
MKEAELGSVTHRQGVHRACPSRSRHDNALAFHMNFRQCCWNEEAWKENEQKIRPLSAFKSANKGYPLTRRGKGLLPQEILEFNWEVIFLVTP